MAHANEHDRLMGIPSGAEEKRLRAELLKSQQENRKMRAKVDAAETTDENRRHWAAADAFGPNAAYHPGVRFVLRNRGRYEAINNSYCRGLVRSLAYDLVGTGPRLQLSIPGDNTGEAAKIVEKNFAKWARAIKFGRKCRVLEKSCSRDGEGFGLLDTNMRLKNPVKLDLRIAEAEQCTTPAPLLATPLTIDGIKFDEFGAPVEYYFLKYHPGETNALGVFQPMEFTTIPAERVLHWFEQDRAGQMRGIPRITSSLPLFAQQRRYTLATLTAAEFAAMLAGIMKTNLPPADGSPVNIAEWSFFEMVRGALMSLPQGWEASQFKPEQPTTTYPEFKREILGEAGRGTGAPLNVTTGNSSGYNFSSGRLDHLPYQRQIGIDRDDFRNVVVDPVFLAWYDEAILVGGQIPVGLPPIEEWAWAWNWDAFDSIDQNKDASADDMRMSNGSATYAHICNDEGDDWQENLEQLAREVEAFHAKGLIHPYEIRTQPAASANDQTSEDPANPPASNPNDAEANLRAALSENGVPDHVAELVVSEFFTMPYLPRRPKPSRNGHTNGHFAGGRS